MTKEEKSLLLIDLCARLPYDVMGSEILNNKIWGLPELLLNVNVEEEKVECSDSLPYSLENFRPYLRPMSSMTDEEKEELYHYYCKEIADNLNTPNLTWELRCCVSNSFGTDWLNAHHFDYRGLIEKGLAIEITEENNPYEN